MLQLGNPIEEDSTQMKAMVKSESNMGCIDAREGKMHLETYLQMTGVGWKIPK